MTILNLPEIAPASPDKEHWVQGDDPAAAVARRGLPCWIEGPGTAVVLNVWKGAVELLDCNGETRTALLSQINLPIGGGTADRLCGRWQPTTPLSDDSQAVTTATPAALPADPYYLAVWYLGLVWDEIGKYPKIWADTDQAGTILDVECTLGTLCDILAGLSAEFLNEHTSPQMIQKHARYECKTEAGLAAVQLWAMARRYEQTPEICAKLEEFSELLDLEESRRELELQGTTTGAGDAFYRARVAVGAALTRVQAAADGWADKDASDEEILKEAMEAGAQLENALNNCSQNFCDSREASKLSPAVAS